jgi:hypothetical protein
MECKSLVGRVVCKEKGWYGAVPGMEGHPWEKQARGGMVAGSSTSSSSSSSIVVTIHSSRVALGCRIRKRVTY